LGMLYLWGNPLTQDSIDYLDSIDWMFDLRY